MLSAPLSPRRLFLLSFLAGLSLAALSAAHTPARAAAPGEICPPPIQPVILVNPTVITNCSNDVQLRSALSAGGHITFNCGPNPVTIPVSAPLVTSATQDIVLDGQNKVTLDGQGVTRILVKPFTPNSHIDKSLGNDLTLQNIRLINGRAPAATTTQDSNARGGAVWVTSPGTRLHIINSIFENNRTTSINDEDNQGGAVFAANIYETVIVGSEFINNEAGNGGAFGAIASGLQVFNSRFAGNKASDASAGGIVRGHGGALHLDGTFNSFNPTTSNKVEVCGCVFENNTAVRGGGAIKVTISDGANTKAIYRRSAFTNNRLVGTPPAEGHGGAIYHIEDDHANGGNEDNLEISESTFAGNFAQRQGGGVWVYIKGRGRIVNTTFHDNRASAAGTNLIGQGGGLVISLGVIDLVNVTFANNFATFQGGALFAGSGPETTVTLYNSLFYQNRLDPTHTNPVTTEWQGYHTNRPLNNGGNNLQFPRTKTPDFNNDVNNLITSPASAILFADPLLGPLTNDSGFTQTRLPGAGSPAINAGNNATCPSVDQRGLPRPQGSACDIGSVEVVLQLSASPSLVAIDDGAFTLTVSGYDFSSDSQIVWRGQPLTTTFVNSTTLRATVPAHQIGAAGVATVTVTGSSLPAATVTVVQTLQRVYLPVVRR